MSRLIVEADGGSRGNPGVAGYGALVRDADSGRVLAERAAPLGRASNNVAEYTGLIEGLLAAEEIDPGAEVDVRMDSKLVVEQMSGRWKIKHEDMQRLAAAAREVVARFGAAGGRVRYQWIPREKNKAADALSNVGMDGRTVRRRCDDTDTDEAAPAPDAPPADVAPAPRPESTRGLGRSAAPTTQGARLVVVRHGVTAFTREGRLDGRGGADPDLDAEGMAQARAAARGVHAFLGSGEPVRVVTSTLARARQTGALIAGAFSVSPRVEAAWDEQDFGEWDGRRVADLAEEDGDALFALRVDPDHRVPGSSESHTDVLSRVRDAVAAEVQGGGTVVVATHRTPIMCVLQEVLGVDYAHAWRLAVAPASITSVRVFADGGAVVEFVNDTSHLRG